MTDLQKLYDKIPSFTCKPNCGRCCGIVPWSDEEFARVKDRLPPGTHIERIGEANIPITVGSVKCPFLSQEKTCTVYDDRPFMCRIFGVSRHPILVCPEGAQPTHPLGREQTDKLGHRYNLTTLE